MHKLAAVTAAAALAIPVANVASAATRPTAKKKVVTTTKKITGPVAQVGDRWGTLEVVLTVKKTTTTVGAKKTVSRRIVAADAPYAVHTSRSEYIMSRSIPYLVQEVLSAQFSPNIQLVSGASDTSYAFVQSLQSALLAAHNV